MDNKTIISVYDAKLPHKENVQKAFNFVCDNFNISVEKHESLQVKINKFLSKYNAKWHEVSRNKQRFEERFRSWLDGDFGIEEFTDQDQNKASTSAASTSSAKRGRPSKPFIELSERGKRRLIDNQVVDPKVDSIEKALLLARRTAYNRREPNLVKVIGHILKNQGNSQTIFSQLTNQRGIMSAEEAFSVLIEAGLSRFQYEVIHRESPSRFPPYNVIGAVKKICAPPGDFIEESGSKIKVKLQALMEKSTEK